MSQNGKLMPNLDHQNTKMLNLTVLQRIDPFVEEILMTAAHVTFYEFNLDQNQWSRKDVEGSLFVVKRNAQPRFQFIVMNRRNTDNLVEDLLGEFEYEIQVPYLLYRNAAQEVNGIWFYNQQECEEIANLFGRILNAYSKVPSKPKVPASKSEFEELEAVPTLAVIEGPLEPSSSSTSAVTDATDDTFVNFFNTSMNMGSNPSSVALDSHHAPSPLPFSSHIPSAAPSVIPTLPVPSPLPNSSIPLMPLLENADPGNSNRATNLVKPSFFAHPSSSPLITPAPASSTMPPAPPVHLPVPLQRPYGTPLLQPFPPPTPSLSLTPPPSGPVITRDKVRDAFVRLAQNNQFIDMVYREIMNAQYQ